MLIMAIQINGEEGLTMKEAAEYLGISPTALNNRVKRLGIQRHKSLMGRERYIKKSDLDRMRAVSPDESESDHPHF